MAIFIETVEAGRGRTLVNSFDDKDDFLCYADEVLACHDSHSMIKGYWTTIDTICEALYDNGLGRGSRYHRRIGREEAREKFREGIAANYCHSWHLSEGAGSRKAYGPRPKGERNITDWRFRGYEPKDGEVPIREERKGYPIKFLHKIFDAKQVQKIKPKPKPVKVDPLKQWQLTNIAA